MSVNQLDKYSTPCIVLYVSMVIATIITSLGVKPAKVESLNKIISFVFGLYTFATIGLTVNFLFRVDVQLDAQA